MFGSRKWFRSQGSAYVFILIHCRAADPEPNILFGATTMKKLKNSIYSENCTKSSTFDELYENIQKPGFHV